MSEKHSKHNKEPKQEFFVLKIGEQQLICTKENTMAFLYENTDYDHIFYMTEEDEDAYQGYHIFRAALGEHFDKLVKRMIKNDFEVFSMDEISEGDLEAYNKAHGIVPEPEKHETTPRQEKLVAFLHYLLENELLTDEEFRDDSGELFI